MKRNAYKKQQKYSRLRPEAASGSLIHGRSIIARNSPGAKVPFLELG
jgi:hypothetical protein